MAARSLRCKGLLAIEVVEEAGVGGGAVAELGLGKELEDGGGHDVRGGVAHDLERAGSFSLRSSSATSSVSGAERSTRRSPAGVVAGVHRLFGLLGFGVGFGGSSRAASVERAKARDDDGCGQARRDAVGDVERRCAVRDFADGAVGKLDLYLLAHKTSIATAAANPWSPTSVSPLARWERYCSHGTGVTVQSWHYKRLVFKAKLYALQPMRH